MPDIDRLLRHGVPIVVGVVLVGGAVWAHQREEVEAAHWVEARAPVVDAVRERDGDQWAPVVELEVNGARIRQTGSYGSTRPATGSLMTVRYDPADPAKTLRVLQSFEALVPAAVLLLGLASLLTGIVGAIRSRAE